MTNATDPQPDSVGAELRTGTLPTYARAERWLGWSLLGGAVALTLLSCAPNSVTRFYTWPWILWWHGLLAFPLLAFVLGSMARRPAPRLGVAFDVGLFLWAAGSFIGAWFSPLRERSLDAALLPIATACVAFVVRGWIGFDPAVARRRSAAVLTVLGVAGTVAVVVAHAMWVLRDVVPRITHGELVAQAMLMRNVHPFGHSLYGAGLAVLLLPLLLGLARAARRGWRTAWLVAAVATLALLVTSGSRGGVLAILAMLAGATVLFVVRSAWSRGRKFAFAGVLLAAGVLLVALNPRLREFVTQRAWSEQAEDSNRQRSAMLEAGWAMGRDRPWIGFGPGTVSQLYPEYRARLSGGVENVLQLHNVPLQVFAEQGALGVVALGLFAAGLIAAVWRLLRAPGLVHSANERVAAWAIVFGCGGYAVFALTDHQLDVPFFAATIAVLLAVLSALTRSEESTHITWSPTLVRVTPAVAVLVAATVIAWYAVPDLRARQAFVQGVIALEGGNAGGFDVGARQAIALAPSEPFYRNQLAAFLADRADRATDPAQAGALRAAAVDLLQQSLAVQPAQEFCHFALGWLALDREQPAEAARHFRAAAQLVPDKGGVYFALGLALVLDRREAAAMRAFAVEWINDPRAATSPVWEEDRMRERRPAVARAAGELITQLARDLPEGTPRRRQIDYVRALLAWWTQPHPDTARAVAQAAREPERVTFFETLASGANPAVGGTADWRIVQRAWQADNPAPVLATLPQWRAALREPLAARLAAHRTSFADVLTAPVGDTPGLVRRGRYERLAFGMLARNSDGLRVHDRYIWEENALATDLLGFLFPPKGWLTGPELTRLLASVPE